MAFTGVTNAPSPQPTACRYPSCSLATATESNQATSLKKSGVDGEANRCQNIGTGTFYRWTFYRRTHFRRTYFWRRHFGRTHFWRRHFGQTHFWWRHFGRTHFRPVYKEDIFSTGHFFESQVRSFLLGFFGLAWLFRIGLAWLLWIGLAWIFSLHI